jgi:N-acetylglucosamine-6-phosphate deacetylase
MQISGKQGSASHSNAPEHPQASPRPLSQWPVKRRQRATLALPLRIAILRTSRQILSRYAITMTQTLRGQMLTPEGWRAGTLQLQADGRIGQVDGEHREEAKVRSGTAPLLLPGFIDTHVHGGGGHDTMAGGEAMVHIARTHARHGTTALLATTMTAPDEEIEAALKALAPHIAQRPAGGAVVLGVHLEGPYINEAKLGAQPPFARAAHLAQVLALHALAPLRLVTIAPELPGHLELIVALRARGFVVQIGHSNATYEQALAALQAGAQGFTHLFNAMSGLHHRAPGAAGAALAHAQWAEIIPDLLHVHPGAIRAALRCIPHLFCVTDSTAAAGMPDGEYRLGRHQVHKCLGGVRLADGTLAGSTLTMDEALRKLVALGLSVAEASRRCSTIAADYLGEADRGRLASGAWADVLELDPQSLELRRVWVQGQEIDR